MSTRRMSLALGTAFLLTVAGAAASRSFGDDAPVARPGDARRVPDYFGQIGLTPQQREQIYTIRARRQQVIDDLLRQVEDERAKMLAECEGVLSETQKGLLSDLRSAARTKGDGRRAAAPAPATPPAEAKSER